jgi:hypothetical protein
MRFSTILDRWDTGEMTQETAAELLGMSVRSFQRWRERYQADGEAGLVDRRGRPSPRGGRRRRNSSVRTEREPDDILGDGVNVAAGLMARSALVQTARSGPL